MRMRTQFVQRQQQQNYCISNLFVNNSFNFAQTKNNR